MNTAKLRLLFIVPLLAAGGCATKPVAHPIARECVRQGKNPECFYVKDEDMAMGNAVHLARKNVRTFIDALQHPSPTQRDFEVKKPFVQGSEVEHIWLSGVTFSGNRFHGRVDNKPDKIKGLKVGDRVSVNPDEISDWAFVDNGNLVGGYTICVLYKQCSPERRKELEHESRFRIKDE